MSHGKFAVSQIVAIAIVVMATAREGRGEVRPAPLRDLPSGQTLRVSDFGAMPDDGKDDLPSIQATIDHALTDDSAVRIVLGRGRFDLYPTGDTRTALRIVHQKNLIIDGEGAELVIHNPKTGLLAIAVSERVIVRDLSVDYDPLPMTQGWVRAVDTEEREFEVEFADGVDLPDGEHFVSAQVKWGIFKDRSHPRALKPGSHNMCPLEKWWKVGSRRFRYRTATWYPMETVEPGDPFVQFARTNGAAIVSSWKSEDVTVDRVRVFASPGAGFVSQLCSRLNLLGVRVEPTEGRWQCLAADGFYCIANRIGPWIEDCVFDATGDDCIIVKSWGANCTKKCDARTLMLAPRPTYHEGTHVFAAQVGDTIRVCDPTCCELLAEFQVAAVERVTLPAESKPQWRITADRDLDNIQPGIERHDPIFYNDDTSSAHFVVRGNTFRNVRRWGLLCMSHDGLIDQNTFERTSAHAILFTSNDAGFRDSDGYVARQVTIRRNKFIDCYTQRPTTYRAVAATIASVVIGGVESEHQADIVEWRGHEKLFIEYNHFIDHGIHPAICLGNVVGNRSRISKGRARAWAPHGAT